MASNRKHTPTDASRARVEVATACGMTLSDVAKLLDVNEMTVQRHYKRELTLGVQKATLMVAQQLYRTAAGQNPAADEKTKLQAQLAWLKMRGGWTEGPTVAVNVNNGNTMTVDARTIDGASLRRNMRALPDATLRTIADALDGLLPVPRDDDT